MNQKSQDLTLSQQAITTQQAKDEAVARTLANTEAGKIWSEIKDKTIDMFALPDQVVSMHCHPLAIDTKKLFLVTNSSAVLPSLETALGNKYVVDREDRFITVVRAPTPFKF